MRTATIFWATLLVSSAATAASSDYYLKFDSVGRDSPDGPIFLHAQSSGDLDGDGAPDEAVVRIACSAQGLSAAHYSIRSPRDSASGQASGKRMHKPVTFVKEWSAATPQLAAMKPTYDIKKVEGTGARLAAGEPSWVPINLSDSGGLCETAARAVKTRSNIQNN